MNKMDKLVTFLILACLLIALADGHGQLWYPPARPFGMANPFQYSGGIVAQYYYKGKLIKKMKQILMNNKNFPSQK